jgi:hypothetical protein
VGITDLFVGITDIFTRFPAAAPGCPVLWLVPEYHGTALEAM